jgi:hypothetical protein
MAMSKKRGQFFTIDAILAAGIFLVVILLVSGSYVSEQDKAQASFMSQDTVRVFTNLRVDELGNEYVQSLIDTGAITRTDNTILEQIGEFWAEDHLELAEKFASNVTYFLVPERFGFGIYVNKEEVYSRDKDVTGNLISSRKIISGIAKKMPTEGFTSKVVLNGIKSKTTNAYSYFSGYEGDGNLVKRLILPDDVISIVNATLEVDTGGDFNLYINGGYSGSYVKGSAGGGEMLADKFSINASYYGNLDNGTNFFTINFTSEKKFIAGGFLKVRYTTSEINDTVSGDGETYWLPGIDGIINYYSSFYIPNTLDNMKIHLDFFSDYPLFFRIGNTTVYSSTGEGSTVVDLDDSTLNSIFLSNGVDFNDLSLKTVPMRLGLNLTESVAGGNADVILITDVSGSMDWRLDSTYTGIERDCDSPYLFNSNTKRISLARCLDKQFVDIVLNESEGPTTNRIGLVSYSGIPNSIPTAGSTVIRSTHDLSSDSASLKDEIEDSYDNPDGATGICSAIRQARAMLEAQSDPSRNKFIVVMTDGLANIQCDPTDEFETVGCIPRMCPGAHWACGWYYTCDDTFCFGGQEGCLHEECGDWVSTTASNNAIDDACRAFNTTDATVFSIGFGPVGSCSLGNETLLSIAECGGGSYYTSTNAEELQNIYNQIAQTILKATRVAQTINISGDIGTSLHPSSYIQLNYSAQELVFGKIPLSFETERFGNNITTGTLTTPENTTIFDARVTSYSSDKWTDKLIVNGNTVYSLSYYNTNYSLLGDPYIVEIPAENINTGDNSLTISTGTSPTNSTGGSGDDRAIYTLLVNGFTDYTTVVAKSEGCNWIVKFEDNSTSTITVPDTYTGGNSCNYENGDYEPDDAMDIATYNLFSNLDIDKDGLLDIKISEENFDIEDLTVTKVPSLWGPVIVEVRVWE